MSASLVAMLTTVMLLGDQCGAHYLEHHLLCYSHARNITRLMSNFLLCSNTSGLCRSSPAVTHEGPGVMPTYTQSMITYNRITYEGNNNIQGVTTTYKG